MPAKGVIKCVEKKDTLCGNLAPKFNFAPGHEGSISCAKTGKFETCTAKCTDPLLAASVPTILCKTIKRITKFIPASAPGGIKCLAPPPTKCGQFAPSISFQSGSSGSIGDCRQVGKNQVCKVQCDDETLAPSIDEVQCRAAKKGKFSFFPRTAKISCKVPPPPLPKHVHAQCGDIFQLSRYTLDRNSLDAHCDKTQCILSCLNAGATMKATPAKLPKNNKMVIKCGKKGFAPKKVKASCTGGSQRGLGLVGGFEDYASTKVQDTTTCFNSIYEKYGVRREEIVVNCTGNKCLVSCKKNGKAPTHIWPDGSSSQRSLFVCKGRFSWSPIRGRIVC
ncbi:Oidioi.mRNA.OKI2018_I69.XSR.g15574.t1.cds [Oikopleura dioica]|uniref:Oidioi.mRNA.OKI2018_I69.XSR.g15574.t1.cds n=1 Tax=Oikopleura dioica TaxID=34765 RepID=A0ABN7SD99_OIKDI|nr:Oidioi.mRNA.OKI2018_I69.XSR.g15574.t1.cds [Oikopleura dioica]